VRKPLITLLWIAVPRAALACPVCFGDVSSPMAKAANMGILVMLVVVAGMLTAFASFFIYLARRAKLAAAAESRPDEGRDLLDLSNPDEGTVRC
jgi:hypothetical protein